MNIEFNKIYNMDCLEGMDEMISQGIKVDAIITDTPYGTISCKWDSIIPFDEMWKRLKTLRKNNNTPIVLFGSEPFSSALRMSNIKEYKYDWYWNKQSAGNILCAKFMPMKIIENILVFGKGKINYHPQKIKRTDEEIRIALAKRNKKIRIKESDMFCDIKSGGFIDTADVTYKNPQNLLNYNARSKECNNVNRLHPTQKPVALLEYLIKTYTNEGDLILDFTIGSGTTAIACLNINRQYIGFELDKNYYDITNKRIQEHIHDLMYKRR